MSGPMLKEMERLYALEAENERLREANAELVKAMERISRMSSTGTRTLDNFIRDMMWINDEARLRIARAALTGGKQ